MVIRKMRDFMDELDNRRVNTEYQGGKGTIWLKNFEELQKVADWYEGGMLSPGGAAGYLGVSRAMIHQLERDGKIRAYRYIAEDKDWNKLPFYLRLLVDRKSQVIYIPVADLDKYAEGVHKRGRARVTRAIKAKSAK
jgi:predicted HTH domain antitoxin